MTRDSPSGQEPGEYLVKELAREILRLPERDRAWIFSWLRQDLASTDIGVDEMDEVNERMTKAIRVLDAVAKHLKLTSEDARLALTMREFDAAPRSVREDWPAQRVRRAYAGSWPLAKAVAFGSKSLPTTTMQHWKRKQELTTRDRQYTFHLSAIWEWLQLKPSSKTRVAYDEWRKQHNKELPPGRRPVAGPGVIQKWWDAPWVEIIKAVEEDRLPKSRQRKRDSERVKLDGLPDPFAAQSAEPKDFKLDGSLLARRVRAARLARGWSQTKLAEEAQISTAVIRRIESGEGQEPSFNSVARMVIAFGISLDLFLTDDGQTGLPPPPPRGPT